ncbi:hypothetical protein FD755_022459, partial [Muntiacus reevesi]
LWLTPCINIPASPFMQKLNSGTGVNVYLMKKSPRGLSHSPWAVKKINPGCNDVYQSMYLKRLTDEAKYLKSLNHSNIIAFTEAGGGCLRLAMECGGEKSLNDLIEIEIEQSYSQDPFPAAIILKIALNMARGLKHLHQDKKLLRGDIKSSNVIKGDFETIKTCDVGVSLPSDENLTVTAPETCPIGTEPWRPEEALDEDGFITNKADVFAFGLTRDFDDDAYYAALGTRLPIDMEELDETYKRVIELFSACTDEDPKGRPSASHTVEASEMMSCGHLKRMTTGA